MYLREHNNIILHIACGDITDVSIEGEKFIINTQEKYILDILNEPQNLIELQKAFEYLGYKEFEIRKSEKLLSNEENIRILNKYFNNEVKVIDKE